MGSPHRAGGKNDFSYDFGFKRAGSDDAAASWGGGGGGGSWSSGGSSGGYQSRRRGHGNRRGGGGGHGKQRYRLEMDPKAFNMFEKLSKGPLGWRTELDAIGELQYDNKNNCICFASDNAEFIAEAKHLLEKRKKAMEKLIAHPVLEVKVAANSRVRLLLNDGYDVQKILWHEDETSHVHFTLSVVDTKPIRFQAIESPKVIIAAMQQLVGTYATSQFHERESIKAHTGLTEKQKAQLASAVCVKDFLGVHRMMRVDLAEARKVLSAAQELLLHPPAALHCPPDLCVVTKGILYDHNNFRELIPAVEADIEAGTYAKVVCPTPCGIFIENSLLVPSGTKMTINKADKTITLVPPAWDVAAMSPQISTGYLLMNVLEGKGILSYRGVRDTFNGDVTGTLHLESTDAAAALLKEPIYIGSYLMEKSHVPPDITKTGLSIPVAMSFQQAKRLEGYFRERLEELKKLMAETMKLQIALEAGFGQYMVRIKGVNKAAMEEIGEYIREFIIKGVVISPQEEASECEDLGFEYNLLLILRMKSKDVNDVENDLRYRGEECSVAVTGTGSDTRIYCVGRRQEEVAQKVRTIIHNHRTRVGMVFAKELRDVEHIAKKHSCHASRSTGITRGTRVVGIAESILQVDYEMKKLEGNACAVCRDVELAQFTISCGSNHSVCKGCIAQWIDYAVLNNAFPLTCPGCTNNNVVKLHDIKDILSLTGRAEDDLVQPALRSYLAKNPSAGRSCTTPDCTGILPIKNGFFTCVECKHESCTDCQNTNHVEKAMTCEEAKNHVLSESDWKTKQFLDSMRACPRCKLKVDKSTGCNAVRCVCGAGFCWLCLQDCGTDGQAHHHFGVPGTPCYAKLFEGVYQ